MALNITHRVRNKKDYQVAVVAAGVSFALSIVSLVLHIKSEEF